MVAFINHKKLRLSFDRLPRRCRQLYQLSVENCVALLLYDLENHCTTCRRCKQTSKLLLTYPQKRFFAIA
jgi:hypothetical protein